MFSCKYMQEERRMQCLQYTIVNALKSSPYWELPSMETALSASEESGKTKSGCVTKDPSMLLSLGLIRQCHSYSGPKHSTLILTAIHLFMYNTPKRRQITM